MAKSVKKQPPTDNDPTVLLRFLDRFTSLVAEIPLNACLEKSAAMHWTRIAAGRAKWQELPGEVASVLAQASALLNQLGLGESQLKQLAQARVVEIHLWWRDEELEWEYRIFPWEFILIQALRPHTAGGATPVIARCLNRVGAKGRKPEPQPLPTVRRMLALVSCPADSGLRESYRKELEMVASYFKNSLNENFVSLPAATFESIRKAVGGSTKDGVDAVHFLGFETEGENPRRSYLWLNGPEAKGLACEYAQVASLVTGGGKVRPRLVAYSFCHTGPRLAAYTVVGGAEAAIGFQDIVLDDQCQNFFGSFYRLWEAEAWDVLKAFERAIREVAFTLEGSGIILWLARSGLEALVRSEQKAPDTEAPSPPASGDATAPPPGGISFNPQSLGAEPLSGEAGLKSLKMLGAAPESRPFPAEPPSSTAVSPASSGALWGAVPQNPLKVSITARKAINYALLHNQQVKGPPAARRTLFETFSIMRPQGQTDCTVDVEVNLNAGDHVVSWRERVDLKLEVNDLAGIIHVPLTSILARSLRESLRTTIETRIHWEGRLVDHRCHPVSMLAIEEWLDDGDCHIWLPSFVLPRDPAVGTIIQRARRCLCALLDDYTAGFDGYQWDLPERVDKQAQAIWATLSLEWQFGYINPPPAYTARSQRLRRPSTILEGGAGTCIDLALLFAACLEFIDVDPVLILANGHAYIGWWRQEFDQFSYIRDVAGAAPAGEGLEAVNARKLPGIPGTASQPEAATTSWVSGKEFHPFILKAVDDGRLMVIETTGLTRHLAFSEAVREGVKRVRSRLDFDYLIDVKLSRSAGITPLPMCL